MDPFWDLFRVLRHDRVVRFILVGWDAKLANLDLCVAQTTIGDASVAKPNIEVNRCEGEGMLIKGSVKLTFSFDSLDKALVEDVFAIPLLVRWVNILQNFALERRDLSSLGTSWCCVP